MPTRLTLWMQEKKKDALRPHVSPFRQTFAFSVLATFVTLFLGYFVLSVASISLAIALSDEAKKKSAYKAAEITAQLFTDKTNHYCLGLALSLLVGTVIATYLCYLFLRKPLLENRRLRFMAGFFPYGGSFRTYSVCSVAVIAFATWLYLFSDVNNNGVLTSAGKIVHLTTALFAVCLSTLITHVFEYSRVSRMFASLEALSLPRAIRATTEAQRERLRLLQTHQYLYGSGTDLDFLPDREQSLTAMTAMAKRLGEQLKDLTERESDDLIFAECDGYARVETFYQQRDASGQLVFDSGGNPVNLDGRDGRAFKPKSVVLNETRGARTPIKLSHPRAGLAERVARFEIPSDKDQNSIKTTATSEFEDGHLVSAGDILVRITRKNSSEELRNVGMNDLIKSYGSVAALFHPDYLPHLSHTYLKLSQMRALNMPPRRIQLLGRQWTLRGLESEYVVVHDVSDIRSDYRERKVTHPGQPAPPAANPSESAEQHETKWRARPLKKRARVVVAPDGSLIRIAIEEERQFNI